MAESTTVTVPNIEEFKQRALRWAEHFNVVCLLDSNNYSSQKYSTYDWVLAADKLQELEIATIDAFKKFQSNSKHEIFGYWSYDLKNQIEKIRVLKYRVSILSYGEHRETSRSSKTSC